jgi:hypothetical protein
MNVSSILFTPCACAEFMRITLGPIDVPIGLTPLVIGAVLTAMLPGLVRGALRRRRFAKLLRSSEPATVNSVDPKH